MKARWESPTRYYVVDLHQDLFEDWVLTISRGGRRSRLGARRTEYVGSLVSGLARIDELEKARLRHGYQRVQLP